MGTLLAASVGADKTRGARNAGVRQWPCASFFASRAVPEVSCEKLPRSGEWLSRVKVVMGFFVLAAMLKYLYSLDAVLQTELPDSRAFSGRVGSAFAMAGFYLLGFVRLPGISRDAELGVARLLIGTVLVVFRTQPRTGNVRH